MNAPCIEIAIDPRLLDAVVKASTDIALIGATLVEEGHPAGKALLGVLDEMDAHSGV